MAKDKSALENYFKEPKKIAITDCMTMIRRAFSSQIIPNAKINEVELVANLKTLGMTKDSIKCAYCGDVSTEWDHFMPLVEEKKPTGYITEINNLVPSCGKCNQSKGNRKWEDWFESNSKWSPKQRNIGNLKKIEENLKKFNKNERISNFFDGKIDESDWQRYENKLQDIKDKLAELQSLADEFKKKI